VADAFLSYAHSDIERVRRLASGMESSGFAIWWDRGDEGIRTGARFDQEILARLNMARAVVVIWSKTSVKSDWVYDEARKAKDQNKLVPARIEDCEIPLGFGRIQAAALLDWNGEPSHVGFRQIVNSVHTLVARAVGGGDNPGAPSGTAGSGRGWTARLVRFDWFGARFRLIRNNETYEVEYRNHFQYESIYLNGEEILKGGTETRLHRAFHLYVGEDDCVIEPFYGTLSRWLTGRLSKVAISVGGRRLAEFP
jgi:TIR domain